ncbi:cyclic-di-AMP receptor [Garciella nitratireducens]|uniref:cyclic-di-AMP receptor n=1 Tax=Garciella nitratireducens TaxID=218205 RepID=UPI000DEB41C2|nr:cyclic-di-AMP receptor [Garciella nitratireducens]RBP42213.1 uncharacterized protein YaaQ [Garciella nitratireducens]
MKMIIAIVQNQDQRVLVETLMENQFHVTKLATTGGFLKVGNTTLLIGVEEERVERVIEIIREVCEPREQIIPNTTNTTLGTEALYSTYPIKVTVGGATIFVVDVERFEKI